MGDFLVIVGIVVFVALMLGLTKGLADMTIVEGILLALSLAVFIYLGAALFTWTIVALVVVLAIARRYLGSYMAAVFEGRVKWLSFVERPVYRALRIDPESEQSGQRYAGSVIVFSAMALAVTYGVFRLQGSLPFNPQHLPGATPALAWNTAVSFVTNTNWQAYSSETTMSYLSQMGSLAVQNFVSAATGTLTVTYTDGSTQAIPVTFAGWLGRLAEPAGWAGWRSRPAEPRG
jgi:Potassium-transporting ATPase A subunit